MTGFDILEQDGQTFKDIYEIMIGIGEQWDKLTDIQRASLGEKLAGGIQVAWSCSDTRYEYI